jgi:glycerol uptake facilitator-like aquaporin
MGKLRHHWVEMIATCVGAVAIASVYTVFVGYAAGS